MNIKDKRELFTILAALDLWQAERKARTDSFLQVEQLIAANEGRMVPMNRGEVDELRERIRKAVK